MTKQFVRKTVGSELWQGRVGRPYGSVRDSGRVPATAVPPTGAPVHPTDTHGDQSALDDDPRPGCQVVLSDGGDLKQKKSGPRTVDWQSVAPEKRGN